MIETVHFAGTRLRRVAAVFGLSLVCAAGAIWAGIVLFTTYGLSPADGGVLAPLASRIAWAGFVSLSGLGFAGGMFVYCGCYVVRIGYDDSSREYLVSTLTRPGSVKIRIRPDDVESAREHRGRIETGKLSVDAPWLGLKIRGRKLPLIVDLRGSIVSETRFQELTGYRRLSI